MVIIGLTGGIACGKSTVANFLRSLGAVVLDGDVFSRELTAKGGSALPAIREAFGEAVFHIDGILNRKALGNIVFGDPKALDRLNGIMQPLLRQLIDRRIQEARNSGVPICILDMPLLFEQHLDKLCDTVWCVTLSENVQLERLMARDGLSREAALARIHSQMPTAEKAVLADTVIDTSGSIDYTNSVVLQLWKEELAKHLGTKE